MTHRLTPMSFPLKHWKTVRVPGPGQAGLPLARIVGRIDSIDMGGGGRGKVRVDRLSASQHLAGFWRAVRKSYGASDRMITVERSRHQDFPLFRPNGACRS